MENFSNKKKELEENFNYLFYLNDEIKINEDEITPIMRECYKNILKYREQKNLPLFSLEWEDMDIRARQAFSGGKISEETLHNVRKWLGFKD